jgi:hypothetical protein
MLIQAPLPLLLSIAIRDDISLRELRSCQAILSKLALAFENGGTRRRTLRESLKETLLHIGLVLRKSLRP